jgi:hypothetical protein
MPAFVSSQQSHPSQVRLHMDLEPGGQQYQRSDETTKMVNVIISSDSFISQGDGWQKSMIHVCEGDCMNFRKMYSELCRPDIVKVSSLVSILSIHHSQHFPIEISVALTTSPSTLLWLVVALSYCVQSELERQPFIPPTLPPYETRPNIFPIWVWLARLMCIWIKVCNPVEIRVLVIQKNKHYYIRVYYFSHCFVDVCLMLNTL